MNYEEAVEAVKNKLFDLICEGGGNAETLDRYAEQIVDLFVEEEA